MADAISWLGWLQCPPLTQMDTYKHALSPFFTAESAWSLERSRSYQSCNKTTDIGILELKDMKQICIIVACQVTRSYKFHFLTYIPLYGKTDRIINMSS
jgi:hypothetical protein